MTTGSNSNHHHHDDGSGRSNNNNNNPSTRSWGTAVSGQSVSTSGSMGSPSSRGEQTITVATSASDSTFLRMNNLDIQGDDAGSQGASGYVKLQFCDFGKGFDLLIVMLCLVIFRVSFYCNGCFYEVNIVNVCLA